MNDSDEEKVASFFDEAGVTKEERVAVGLYVDTRSIEVLAGYLRQDACSEVAYVIVHEIRQLVGMSKGFKDYLLPWDLPEDLHEVRLDHTKRLIFIRNHLDAIAMKVAIRYNLTKKGCRHKDTRCPCIYYPPECQGECSGYSSCSCSHHNDPEPLCPVL